MMKMVYTARHTWLNGLIMAAGLSFLALPTTPHPLRAETGPPVSGVAPPAVAAQLAFREGLASLAVGRKSEGRRHFDRAAALDPTFAAPHFAASETWLPFRPDQAISAMTRGWRAEARTFRGQHRMALNAALLLLAILAGAAAGAGALVAFRALGHFQHPLYELANQKLPPLAAAAAAWIVVAQPLLWGLGFFLTLALVLGLTWATLSAGERRVAIAAVCLGFALPLAMGGLSRMASPLDPDSLPYLLSAASETPGQPGLGEALERRLAVEPPDAATRLARGLVAESQGDWARAEQEYQRGLLLRGDEARLRNNLGNALLRLGREDEAAAEYQKAADRDRRMAAPHFNLAQLHARRLQFDRVDHEMKVASRLDFDRVRAMTSQETAEHSGLMSMGVDPAELWRATFGERNVVALGLPPLLAWFYGGALGLLPFFTLGLFGGGLALGRQIHRFLPTYACANCSTVVCRKCLRRIRRRAYCVACGETILSLKTSEFTKMLLERQMRETTWFKEILHVALQVVVPGWAAVRRGRPFVGLGLMAFFMAIVVPVFLRGSPLAPVPALAVPATGSIWIGLGFGLAVLYGLSVALLKWLPEPDHGLLAAEEDAAHDHDDRPSFGRAA